ncbi:hypothetical protein L1049_021587 [Liquidambar formosana]|uniref:S-protein homolog n=1 Tax=Liquidambar formosana TaxID=63359 RepID=A0AAP0N683_LIQFO
MSRKNNRVVFLLMLQLITLCNAYGFSLLEKIHVTIGNHLGDGLNCSIHCKCKDDDLGVHVLQFQGNYEWSFRPKIWGTTLYFCNIQWRDAAGTLDIFRAKRDWNRCGPECLSIVTPEGPCQFNYDSHAYDICCGGKGEDPTKIEFGPKNTCA